MLWKGRRESTNVEDRRGMSGKGIAVGGGIIGVIVLLLNMFLGGGDPSTLPDSGATVPTQQLSPEEQAKDDELKPPSHHSEA